MPTFESPPVFAKRVNLPEEVIRLLAKQGKLPFIKPRKSHIQIHVEAAEIILEQMAKEAAFDRECRMPVYVTQIKPKKHSGRPPDSVRLAKQNFTNEDMGRE